MHQTVLNCASFVSKWRGGVTVNTTCVKVGGVVLGVDYGTWFNVGGIDFWGVYLFLVFVVPEGWFCVFLQGEFKKHVRKKKVFVVRSYSQLVFSFFVNNNHRKNFNYFTIEVGVFPIFFTWTCHNSKQLTFFLLKMRSYYWFVFMFWIWIINLMAMATIYSFKRSLSATVCLIITERGRDQHIKKNIPIRMKYSHSHANILLSIVDFGVQIPHLFAICIFTGRRN